MNPTLHADDAIFTKRSSNLCVIYQGCSFFVDFAITMLVDQCIYWPQVWVPHAIYSSTILSIFIEALLSLTKVPLIWWRQRSCSTFWTFLLTPSILLILMTNATLGSTGTQKRPAFLAILAIRLCSVLLPIFLVIVLRFFIDNLPPCLSKHLFCKLLSQALDLQLCEIPSLFVKGFWHSRNLVLILFCNIPPNWFQLEKNTRVILNNYILHTWLGSVHTECVYTCVCTHTYFQINDFHM